MRIRNFYKPDLRPIRMINVLMVTIILFCSYNVSAQARRIELSDMKDMVGLSAPKISPDGKKIVLVVSRPNFELNRYEKELVLVDIALGTMRSLTYDRLRVNQPKWSPNGDKLAFLDTREKEKTQVYVLSMYGGEAKCITNAPKNVNEFAWSPDGKYIAYVTEDEPEERPESEKHNKSFVVGDNDYLATSEPLPSHIWIVPTEGGSAKRLTSGIAGVLKSSNETICWSPGGKEVVFSSQPKPHSGERDRGSLKRVEIASGDIKTIDPGPIMATSPLFSPDGKHLAYGRPVKFGAWFNLHGIYVVPASGGKNGSCVTGPIDRTFYNARWMQDSKSILISGFDKTQKYFWIQPINIGTPHRLDIGKINPSNEFVGKDGAIAFIGTQPYHPAELYYMSSVDAKPKRLTDYNSKLASLQLGKAEAITWQGPDDFEEDGVLLYPPDFDKKKKYPLVLHIHGGPMGTSTDAFDLHKQVMAAKGWVVFSPNYRGSNNRGEKYQTAVINDAGDGPGRDVMAGIAAVKKMGFVDEEGIAVSGWSYGGYMTTWLTSHYDGWRCAVAGAAVTEYADSYNLSDVNVVFGAGFNYSPWIKDGAKIWLEQSPIYYVQNIKTPTLILSNTRDLRVPVTQSYKLYHALKENNVPVKFIAYPLDGHFPGDPVHRRDVYKRWTDWIAQYFNKP